MSSSPRRSTRRGGGSHRSPNTTGMKRPRRSTNNTTTTTTTTTTIPSCRRKVIIIGAGMSGIACGRELVERGWDVLIVEGRGRVGGRLWGISLSQQAKNSSSKKIDVGGALIHGIDGNPLTRLCHELGLPTTSDLNDTLLLDDAGWPIDSKVDQTTTQQFNHVLEKAFEIIKHKQQKSPETKITSRKRRLEKNDDDESFSHDRDQQTNTNGHYQKQQDRKRTTTTTNGKRNGQHHGANNNNNNITAPRLKRPPSSSEQNPRFNGTNANKNENHKMMTATTPNHHHPDVNGKKNGSDCYKNEQQQQHSSKVHVECPVATTSATAASSTDNDDDNDTDDDDNFGHLCDNIRRKENIPNSGTYLWHQLSLELSCGASLDQLGYRWNEDEAYGFDGAHVALSNGITWQDVVQQLAEPLNVMLHSKVVEIRVIQAGEEVVREDNDDDDDATTSNHNSPTRQSKRLARRRVGSVVESYNEERLAGGTTANTSTSSSSSPRRVSSRTNKGVPEMRWEGGHIEDTLYAYRRNIAGHDSSNNGRYRPTTKPRVWVTLESGVILEADAVVCTLPLGVLQSNTVNFVLPSTQQRHHHDQLGCGLLNKCILKFEKVFWQDVDFLGLCDVDESYIILNGHVVTGEPILIVMLAGEQAKKVEQLSDQDVVEHVLDAITRICQLPPGTVLTPIDYYLTRWGQDPYSKMSFSFVPPNVPGQDAYRQVMEPITTSSNLPVLCFAGEHTTPYHPSTIHGAYLSGIREAYRLDLTYESKSNNGLIFDSKQIYERTFQCSNNGIGTQQETMMTTMDNGNHNHKVAASFTKEEDTFTQQQQKQQHSSLARQRGRHRRRTSGHMQLRSRTTTRQQQQQHDGGKANNNDHGEKQETLDQDITTVTTKKAHEPPSTTPSRRSRRTLRKSRFHDHGGDDDTNSNNKTKKNPNNINSTKKSDPMAPDVELMSELTPEQQRQLEERVMERAIESYEDWKCIESVMLPLWHGPPLRPPSSSTEDGKKKSKQNKKKQQEEEEEEKQQQRRTTTRWKQLYRKLRGRLVSSSRREKTNNSSLTRGWLAPLQL